MQVWLGGVFTAEAFITATRQQVSVWRSGERVRLAHRRARVRVPTCARYVLQVAQANTWSLEELHLHVHVGKSGAKDAFIVTGAFGRMELTHRSYCSFS